MKVVEIQKNVVLIEFAEALLARCKAGEIVSVMVVEELPGGLYTTSSSGSQSRFATAGMLLDAAIIRLTS